MLWMSIVWTEGRKRGYKRRSKRRGREEVDLKSIIKAGFSTKN
jgi:hypothetical protein